MHNNEERQFVVLLFIIIKAVVMCETHWQRVKQQRFEFFEVPFATPHWQVTPTDEGATAVTKTHGAAAFEVATTGCAALAEPHRKR